MSRLIPKIETKFYAIDEINAETLPTKYLIVINYLIAETKAALDDAGGNLIQPYFQISTKTKKIIAGNKYKLVFDGLIKMGHIAVHKGARTGKESYCADKKNRFCKKYKLSQKFIAAIARGELVTVTRKVGARKKSCFTETAVPSCPVTQKIVQNYAAIRVSSFSGLNYSESVLLQGVYHGITNANRINKAGRVSHRLLLAHSKEARKRVTVDGETLMEVDASCLHCFLMAHFITDAAERRRWLQICEEDAYSHFGARSNAERELYKRCLQKALSKKEPKGKTAQRIISYIKTNFPNLHSWIKEQWTIDATVQSQLQQLEAKIFVDEAFLTASFWCLPVHDCLLVKKSDREIATAHLKKAALRILGFNLMFDRSPTNPNDPSPVPPKTETRPSTYSGHKKACRGTPRGKLRCFSNTPPRAVLCKLSPRLPTFWRVDDFGADRKWQFSNRVKISRLPWPPTRPRKFLLLCGKASER